MTEEGLERRRLQKLEKAGIKVQPAAIRYSRSERRHESESSWCCGVALQGRVLMLG